MQRPCWSHMNVGISKTLYQIGMVFNIRIHTQVDTLV
jgi:hypothetical protein